MLEEKELKIIEEKTKEFFERMGLDVEIEMNYLKEENPAPVPQMGGMGGMY